MFSKCVKSIKRRGIMSCVRGEAWFVYSADRGPPFHALGWGTLTDALYQAHDDCKKDHVENAMVTVSIKNGVEARILHESTYLVII